MPPALGRSSVVGFWLAHIFYARRRFTGRAAPSGQADYPEHADARWTGEDQQRSDVQRRAGPFDPATVKADMPGGDHRLRNAAGTGEAQIPEGLIDAERRDVRVDAERRDIRVDAARRCSSVGRQRRARAQAYLPLPSRSASAPNGLLGGVEAARGAAGSRRGAGLGSGLALARSNGLRSERSASCWGADLPLTDR